MNPMMLLALMAFALLLAQGLLGALQYRSIQKQYKEVKTRNPFISVGRRKRLGMTRMALLAFGEDGALREGYLLQGVTVFARFRPLRDAEGRDCRELEKAFSGRRGMAAAAQAAAFASEKFYGAKADQSDQNPRQPSTIKEEVLYND